MKKGIFQLLTMTAGTLLTIAIVFAQITGFDTTSPDNVKTEQGENSTADNQTTDADAVISLPSFSLPAPVTLSSDLEGHLLFEILFEEQEQENTENIGSDLPRRLLVTLFRFIISPNAP